MAQGSDDGGGHRAVCRREMDRMGKTYGEGLNVWKRHMQGSLYMLFFWKSYPTA